VVNVRLPDLLTDAHATSATNAVTFLEHGLFPAFGLPPPLTGSSRQDGRSQNRQDHRVEVAVIHL
jgi:hypothetical protein